MDRTRVDPVLLPALQDEEAAIRSAYERVFADEEGRWEPFFPDPVVAAIREALPRMEVREALLEALYRAVARLVDARAAAERGEPHTSTAHLAELQRLEKRTHHLLRVLGIREGLTETQARAEMARVQALVGGWSHGLLRHVKDVGGLVEALMSFQGEVVARIYNRGKRRGRGRPTDAAFTMFLADVVTACLRHGFQIGASPGGPGERLVRTLVAAVPGEVCPKALSRAWLPAAVRAARKAVREPSKWAVFDLPGLSMPTTDPPLDSDTSPDVPPSTRAR